MVGRANRHDRAIREPQWVIRLITIVILAAGVAVVAYAITRPEARRERALGGVLVGDTTSVVIDRLGDPPAVCAATNLVHLHGQFPPGWSSAAQERAIEWLEEETAERWVYPLGAGDVDPCLLTENVSELGIGLGRRVLWVLPVAGRQPLQLPDDLGPGTFTEIPDA